MKGPLFVLFIVFALYVAGQSSHAQCTTCSFSAVNGGNYSLANGSKLCINSNIPIGINLSFDGLGNSICVGKGITWKQTGINNFSGVTIDVQGTLIINDIYSANGPVVINVLAGGTLVTTTGGFGSNLTINNYGSTTFTTGNVITNQGTCTLNNFAGGTFEAPNTALFIMAPGSSLVNFGALSTSNLENQNANIQNFGSIVVGRNFNNHGNFINGTNSTVQVLCSSGSGSCAFTVGSAEPGRTFTNNGCMSINGAVTFAGPGSINGLLEVLGSYDLTLNATVSGNGGQLLVNKGTSTISPSGQYTGRNMKFCDRSTTADHGFDADIGKGVSTYLVDCNAIGCDGAARPQAAACNLNLTAAPGVCDPATNQYSLTGVVSLTGNTVSGLLTLTDGTNSTTLTVPANTSAINYSVRGLSSNASNHILVAGLKGCNTVNRTYTAPAACGCSPLNVTISRSASAICAGQAVILTGQVREAGKYTYAWKGPGLITNSQTASATISNLITGTYTYTLTVSSLPTCHSSLTTTITVNALPNISINSISNCQVTSTTLTATGGTSYRFSDGTTTTTNATGQFIVLPNPALTYSILVADTNSCFAKKTFSLSNTASLPCDSSYRGTELITIDQVRIYPNPTTNGLITIEPVNDLENVDIIGFSLNGQELFYTHLPLLTDRKIIDLSALATGLYVVRVRSKNFDVSKRIVIER